MLAKQGKYIIKAVALSLALLMLSCVSSGKNSVKYAKRYLPTGSNIALVINAPETAKNMVVTTFMNAGFAVKSVNVMDAESFTYFEAKATGKKKVTFKLDLYSLEANKAEALSGMKAKLGVNYLVIMELKDWQKTSWARVIDLQTYELIWVENFPTRYNDNIGSLTNYFITSMTGEA